MNQKNKQIQSIVLIWKQQETIEIQDSDKAFNSVKIRHLRI